MSNSIDNLYFTMIQQLQENVKRRYIRVFQGVFIFSLVKYKRITYMDYEYPWWGDLIGWFMALSSILVMPGYAIYLFLVTPGTFQEVCMRRRAIVEEHTWCI